MDRVPNGAAFGLEAGVRERRLRRLDRELLAQLHPRAAALVLTDVFDRLRPRQPPGPKDDRVDALLLPVVESPLDVLPGNGVHSLEAPERSEIGAGVALLAAGVGGETGGAGGGGPLLVKAGGKEKNPGVLAPNPSPPLEDSALPKDEHVPAASET